MGKPIKGFKRLYECEDCHERRFIPWIELNRAAKPRCFRCGSTKLELVSEDAKKDRAELNQVRIIGGSGSVVLAAHLYDRHHTVR